MLLQRTSVMLILWMVSSLAACRSSDSAVGPGDAESRDAGKVDDASPSTDSGESDAGPSTDDAAEGATDHEADAVNATDVGSHDARGETGVLADASAGGDAGAVSDADAVADAGAIPDTGNAASNDDAGTSAEFAYVATYLGGVLGYSVVLQTGALVPLPGSPFDAHAGLFALALHPSGAFLYVADYRAVALDAFRIDRSTGALDRLSGFPFPVSPPVQAGDGPVALTIHPAGRFAYVINGGNIEAYAIDAASGGLTRVLGSPFAPAAPPAVLAVEPGGRYLYASHAFDGALAAYAVDGVSGALTEVQGSPFSATQGRGAIVFHPNGQFIFKGGGSISAFRFDPTSGALAEVAGSPVPGGGSDPSAIDVAIDPRGQYLYAVTTSTGLLRGYAIDPDSGALVEVPGSPFPAGPFPYSVGVDPSGRFVYVGNDDAAEVSGFSIDRVTGTLSPLAQSAFVADGLQPEFAFVAAD